MKIFIKKYNKAEDMSTSETSLQQVNSTKDPYLAFIKICYKSERKRQQNKKKMSNKSDTLSQRKTKVVNVHIKR